MKHPRTWATIDLGAVERNFQRVREEVGQHVRIMGVIKADAYGHGAVQVARVLARAGAAMLGVGDSSEAIELREEGISLPIVILGSIVDKEVEEVVHYGITPTLHSLARAKMLAEEATRQGKKLDVHIMVDTGMGRLGVRPESVGRLAECVLEESGLTLAGLSTHFASSQNRDKTFARAQLDRFTRVRRSLKRKRIKIPCLHAANSAAVFSMPSAHMNMVRPGIALYGMDPGNFEELGVELEPALTLKTQVAYIKNVKAGTPIGYDSTYRAYRSTRIATCSIGYNDGFPLVMSGGADVIIRGRRAPLTGRTSMDYIMVDVGHIPGVDNGDEVTIIGTDGEASITAKEVAGNKGSIPYEVTCSLGKRVKKIYVDEAADEKSWTEDRKRA